MRSVNDASVAAPGVEEQRSLACGPSRGRRRRLAGLARPGRVRRGGQSDGALVAALRAKRHCASHDALEFSAFASVLRPEDVVELFEEPA